MTLEVGSDSLPNKSAGRESDYCVLRRGQGLRPFPRAPFSAGGALPPLRSGQILLDDSDQSWQHRSASVASLRRLIGFLPE